MSKRILGLLLSIVICLAALPINIVYGSNNDSFSVTANKEEYNIGDQVDVKIDMTGATDLYAFEVGVKFDDQKLLFIKGTIGDDFEGFVVKSVQEDYVYFGFTGLTEENGIDGDINLCTLTFKAIAGDQENIQLDYFKSVTQDLLTEEITVSNAKDSITILNPENKNASNIEPEFDFDDEFIAQGMIQYSGSYIKGYTDGSFRGNNKISRAEVAAIFTRILALNSSSTETGKYLDVENSYWAYEAIENVSDIGLFNGEVDGNFNPNRPITRAEIAAVITRYWDYVDYQPKLESVQFADIKTHWAKESIEELYSVGLVYGFPDGTYKPNESLSRYQAVSIFNRLIGRVGIQSAVPHFSDVNQSHWAYKAIEAAAQ